MRGGTRVKTENKKHVMCDGFFLFSSEPREFLAASPDLLEFLGREGAAETNGPHT